MRSNVFERIMKRSPEEIEESKQSRKKEIEELSLEYQLGYYIGEYIFHRTLPTLSCDDIKSRNVIQVSTEETNELKNLTDIWFNKRWNFIGTEEEKKEATKEEWDNLKTYQKMLDDKYYPKTIQTHISPLIDCLWNCDCCSYSLKEEDILIETDNNYFFTIITLKR